MSLRAEAGALERGNLQDRILRYGNRDFTPSFRRVRNDIFRRVDLLSARDSNEPLVGIRASPYVGFVIKLYCPDLVALYLIA